MDVGVLLYHIERFPGIIVLTTNIIDHIDKAFFRRLKFVLYFGVPSYKLRERLWKVVKLYTSAVSLWLDPFLDLFPLSCAQLLIPEETPLGSGIDFQRLSNHEMSGGNIKSAIFRAASRAALR